MKKSLKFLLILLAASTLLTSCHPERPTPETTTAPSTEQTAPVTLPSSIPGLVWDSENVKLELETYSSSTKAQIEVTIKKSKAEAAKLELKELQGKMHRAEDVEAITTDHVLYFRSMLTAIPGKLAVDCANCKTAAEAAERIQQEVYYILDELSNYRYDPDEYKKRVRERQGWESEQRENDDE